MEARALVSALAHVPPQAWAVCIGVLCLGLWYIAAKWKRVVVNHLHLDTNKGEWIYNRKSRQGGKGDEGTGKQQRPS